MIDDMKDTQVIIYSGETDNWGVPPVEKLSLVNKFIKDTFPNNLKVLDWDIRFK